LAPIAREARFAIATLGKALRNQKEKMAIAERLEHALSLTRGWIESTGRIPLHF